MNSGNSFRKSGPRSNRTRNRGGTSGLTTKMQTKIRKRNDPALARRVVTIGVMVSVLMVGVSLFVTFYFDSEAVAKRKFAEMATTYYETYYHDKFMESLDPKYRDERLEQYEQSGLQPVLLRQLLLYQNGKYSSYKKYFEDNGYVCDKNETSAVFYPVKPYGVKDYRVEYIYSCIKE